VFTFCWHTEKNKYFTPKFKKMPVGDSWFERSEILNIVGCLCFRLLGNFNPYITKSCVEQCSGSGKCGVSVKLNGSLSCGGSGRCVGSGKCHDNSWKLEGLEGCGASGNF
jgi:hypothetical protein